MTYEIYRGKILVATPQLDTDPMFSQSIVFIYEERGENVFGLILNKPSKLRIKDVAKLTGNPMHQPEFENTQKIYAGGPVEGESLALLHSNEWYSQNTYQIPHNLAISSDTLMVQKVMTGNLPRDYKMFAGLSTWHKRQLAMEIHHGSWLTISDPPPNMFFAQDGKNGWMNAVHLASAESVDNFF